MKTQIIIAHPFKQHSFKTAMAIKKSGHSFKYITTVYAKKGSITYLIKKLIRGEYVKKINTHYCNELCDKEVIQFCELRGIIVLILRRINKNSYIYYKQYNKLLISFSKKVADYATENNVKVVIMYDTLSHPAFKLIKEKKPCIKTIIDMSAPFLPYMYDIYIKDTEQNMEQSILLKDELSNNGYINNVKNSFEEIKWADYFISASEFTNKSLEFYGVRQDKIFLCRYGINSNFFKSDLTAGIKKTDKDKLRCCYTGNINQKKGMLILARVIESVDINRFSFTFIGRFDPNSDFYKKYKNTCRFTGFLNQDEIIKEYKNLDVMIFPSLADGFGNSVLEAMSCGLTAIVSSNAGISDIIIEGYNGFVVDIYDYEQIVQKLLMLKDKENLLKELKLNAQKTALSSKWQVYNNNICNMLENLK
ncbi:glycosyltransferase family 4 protein [Acetobacterium sp.]|uniref:glycosyltransferase family 4 protein n=1 Tax=Acetobacterium sp. TaxID=1872094 RepID=UPI0027289A42|nr:glycosyltransferase family 4 protein [Acetobacterium sp.]MDO9493752.1 glycosyltransferase family 4 protein [Acetobacterium sp.]